MHGLVPRTGDWRAEMEWVREAGRDGLILFEAVSEGFGALQDALRRDGFQVVGGSALGDRLENDRAFAQEVLARAGLPVAPWQAFSAADAALDYIAARPRRYVLKGNGSGTFAGQLPDGRDVAAVLRVRGGHGTFLLQDHVEGVETGVGAYFNGQRFLRPACLDWEHKRFFPGDLGELTGEMGTVATFEGSERLFERTLLPLEPMLREAGHVGWVNLNTIVNADGIWPLEFTCRFGYPGFAVLAPLQPGWGELLARMLDPASERFSARPGFSVGIVLTTPPFPYSRHQVDELVGLPILLAPTLSEGDREHIHLGEVGTERGQLVTAGLYGWTAVVTGTGAGVKAARDEALERLAKVTVPNGRYRRDIGDRLLGGDHDRLRAWGLLA